ncbi:MAG: methyltransferase domain-containing protein, partial [Pseudomonadota bacterium]
MAATTIRSDTTERHVSKYSNPNPIHRLSLGRFYDAVAAHLTAIAPSTVLDFGCGEGYILDMMAQRDVAFQSYEGLDLRADALTEARRRWPQTSFVEANLFDAAYDHKRYHTVMALEVLEHLFEPEKVLRRLVSMADEYVLLTVPNEPWFQLMNLVRGRDLIRLGNHPEHINHWNKATFAEFVEPDAEIVRI